MSTVATDIGTGLGDLPRLLPRIDWSRVPVAAIAEVLMLLAGAGLVSYGAWLAWHPAGFLLGGLQLICGTILNARGSPATRPRGR